ncbi:hypothetical protein IFM58399_01648 [Aspergillus lentulus]|uniref:Uncharacterized protein n=1 Tax=Aspergillus lentulus TaxID=293939 RepID=A0ABQ1A127_ASPLE|nr:uncharacterized protein IFM58399_01648 [Aspergillus lentulus]GFF27279.1 hypothetical protein IFM58399_01648 [Aspergillus lentulus]GFF48641.1 hypothetical protein IFM62136_01076 [Aspergillus lentulus]GFF70868.1 hypothetical protein IFM60648_03279 [Aspergillus lentulus]GFF82746.1 hypothetical protein IFM47457_05911 [Aspergillus lentulus]GFG12437.1 hypothetical protein IFM61392_07413 [Aspergillus lentulus]
MLSYMAAGHMYMAVITSVESRAATTASSPRRRTSITDSRRDYGQDDDNASSSESVSIEQTRTMLGRSPIHPYQCVRMPDSHQTTD